MFWDSKTPRRATGFHFMLTHTATQSSRKRWEESEGEGEEWEGGVSTIDTYLWAAVGREVWTDTYLHSTDFNRHVRVLLTLCLRLRLSLSLSLSLSLCRVFFEVLKAVAVSWNLIEHLSLSCFMRCRLPWRGIYPMLSEYFCLCVVFSLVSVVKLTGN